MTGAVESDAAEGGGAGPRFDVETWIFENGRSSNWVTFEDLDSTRMARLKLVLFRAHEIGVLHTVRERPRPAGGREG